MKKILKYTGVWAKRIGFFLLIFVLLLSGLLHSVWFQSVAGRYAGEFCSRWSGHEVHIGHLQFSLFKRAVSICDLRILDKAGEPMVEAESVYLSLSNYVFKGVDIAALSVRRPRVRIVRRENDSMSDFKALLQKLGTLKKDQDKRSVTSIRQLRVGSGFFSYEDRSVPNRGDGCIDFKHVEVPLFDAHIQNLHIFNKHVCARVRALSAREKGGMDVKSLRAWVGFSPDRLVLKELELETAGSHVKGNLQFGYCNPRAFSDFSEAVNIEADIASDSHLNTRDLGYFSQPFQAYGQTVFLSGRVSGRLKKDIAVRNLAVRFGKSSRLSADLHWRGFPALKGSDLDLRLAELYVDKQDILGIEDFASGRRRLPAVVRTLDYVAVQGKFKGDLEKFDTRLAIRTNLGDVDIDVRSEDTLQEQRLQGVMTASALNAGVLIGRSDIIGTLDADLQVSA
ncbi:MAG: hypothetical protein K2O01_08745, partial [Bacteroidales bacterium]|nr:hypothetical protein [Bacteroidales bacterium]